MEIKDITQKLIEQSDKDLKAEIESAFQPAASLVCDGSYEKIAVEGQMVSRYEALESLKDKAFQIHR